MTSVDSAPWTITIDDRPPTVEVVCPKQTVILSWNQFVYAEGSDDEVRLAFASHDVIVKGSGLSQLLPAIKSQQVTSIRQPLRLAAFTGLRERFIREIEIRRIDAD
jgi:hypothetical protein